MSLPSQLLPSRTRAWGVLQGERPSKMKLGQIGICPKQPSVTIFVSDDSGSVTVPGGHDPIGNRYEEARLAFAELRYCGCGKCRGAVVHFDTPVGDVPAGSLSVKSFQRRLTAGLSLPAGAAGTSFISPALDRVDAIVAALPGYTFKLVILTDWELFDEPSYIERILSFPGSVLTVGLETMPPEPLDADNVRRLRIAHGDAPGTLARALFAVLCDGRDGARLT